MISDRPLLLGKKCLITGGTRGLGLAIAKEFVKQGATDIAVTYAGNEKDALEAERVLKEMGASPLIYRGSVCDSQHVLQTIKDLQARWKTIDVLVNNAGILQIMPLALIEEKDWDKVMDVNVKGAFLYSQAVLRVMLKAKAGSILNIGTFSSERVIETPVHYAVSKSALRGLTEAFAKEVGRYGIRVNLLAPGALNEGVGRMLPKHRFDDYLKHSALGRIGDVQEIARFAAFLVSEECSFVTGSKSVLDGGI